jgi:chorismate mutase
VFTISNCRAGCCGKIKKLEQAEQNFMRTTRLFLAVMTLFAADTKAGTEEQLAVYRQQIDSIDQRIVELFQQRARVVEEVGNIKREAHLPVTVSSREQQVIEKAQELAKGGPLPAEAVGRIYQKLVEEMRNWEAELDAKAPQLSSQPTPTDGNNKVFTKRPEK